MSQFVFREGGGRRDDDPRRIRCGVVGGSSQRNTQVEGAERRENTDLQGSSKLVKWVF